MHKVFEARSTARRWMVTYPRAVPIVIFLLIGAITALSCLTIEQVENQRAEAQLRERAGAIASALERRANANSSYLRAGAALFATQQGIPPMRFRRFVRELRLDEDFRGSEGIGWARRVEPGGVAEFDRLLEQEFGAGVSLHPALAPGENQAVPVTFLEPDSVRNRRALGFDMYSEAKRRAAIDRATITARPSASGLVVLEQEGPAGEAPGFLIYMPVFVQEGGGRSNLRGFVFGAYSAPDFLASALELESAGDVGVRLFDEEIGPDNLLASADLVGEAGAVTLESVEIADHRWVLEVTAAKGSALSLFAMLTLIFGLLVASLLTLVVRMLTRQALEDGARLDWYEEQNEIRDSLTRELNHRVKNTLANVLSIVALTRRRATSIDEFAEGLDGRIRALSATHDLLTQSDWGSTPVRSVIEAELAPYARDSGQTIELQGPIVDLAPNDALSLGLALHELATNAAKYGSLSVPEGRLTVHWALADEGRLRIEWTEQEGPQVPFKRARGFGVDLIEKVVAHELQNPVDLRFDPDGVRCTLLIPVREPRSFEMRSSGAE